MQLALKTIMVATDFGDAANLALEYASVLARRFGANLRIVHAVEMPMMLGTEFGLSDAGRLTERAIEDRQAQLAETVARVSGDEVIGQLLVGDPAQKIVEYAADHAVDLIVMGTHGRRAIAHLLMGSVAEQVVRTAPCPVFTVRDSGALQRETTVHTEAVAT